MNWDVIVRLSVSDEYEPSSPTSQARLPIMLLDRSSQDCVQENIFTLLKGLGVSVLPPRVEDLLVVALSVYAADLSVPRAISEDRWTRSMTLHVPVFDDELWQTGSNELKTALEFLSGDRWNLTFRKRKQPQNTKYEGQDPIVDQACLFSGGVDSLVGAIDLLEEEEVIGLVSHHGAGITHSVQSKVYAALENAYPETAWNFDFYVQPRKLRDGIGESTMRARSFLFLCLGVAVANILSSANRLVVAENGLISLNVPLTLPRLGSLSTRTTHPYFLYAYRAFLQAIGIDTEIELPYALMTKGEMIGECDNSDLLEKLLPKTMSCTHPEVGRYSGGKPGIHCGYCVPCMIRRAAIAVVFDDKTKYGVDVLTSPPSHDCDVGRDFRAIKMALARRKRTKPSTDLFSVLSTGPLDPDAIKDFVDVYQRGLAEVAEFLSTGE